MTTLNDIKSAIEKLSLQERADLARWFHGWVDDSWDAQMTQDSANGRLDDLLKEVDVDVQRGRLRELP